MSSLNRRNKGYVKRKKSIKNWNWIHFEIDVSVKTFYKVLENESPKYLFKLILVRRKNTGMSYSTLNININDAESTDHFILHCAQLLNQKRTLLTALGNFNYSLLENISKILTQTLLFGNMSLSSIDNSKTLNAAIDFNILTKKVAERLF